MQSPIVWKVCDDILMNIPTRYEKMGHIGRCVPSYFTSYKTTNLMEVKRRCQKIYLILNMPKGQNMIKV